MYFERDVPEQQSVFLTHKLRPDIMQIISRPPQSWIDSSLSQIQARIPVGRSLEGNARRFSEERWEKVSGFGASDSKLAIVVPIHDEEASLRDFLEVFTTLTLPESVNARVIFATNACSDKSREIVINHLSRLGNPVTEALPEIERDRGLDPVALTVRRGNLRFTNVDTETPGKANALSVANELALADGYSILINSDANTYPEPDAIAGLYGKARRNFEAEKAVIVWGRYYKDFRPGWQVKLAKVLGYDPDKSKPEPILSKSDPLGWLFAVNSQWLLQSGGVPEVATEDRALSVLARAQGKEMEVADGSFSHGFFPNNLKDDFKTMARFVRGAEQIKAMGEPFKTIVEEDSPDRSGNFNNRLKYLSQRVFERKNRVLVRVMHFLFTEAAIVKGKLDYKRNSEGQSWDKIKSTS